MSSTQGIARTEEWIVGFDQIVYLLKAIEDHNNAYWRQKDTSLQIRVVNSSERGDFAYLTVEVGERVYAESIFQIGWKARDFAQEAKLPSNLVEAIHKLEAQRLEGSR